MFSEFICFFFLGIKLLRLVSGQIIVWVKHFIKELRLSPFSCESCPSLNNIFVMYYKDHRGAPNMSTLVIPPAWRYHVFYVLMVGIGWFARRL